MPFASLARTEREQEIIPGFGRGGCTVAPGRALSCSRIGALQDLEVQAMAKTLRDCFGGEPLSGRPRRMSVLRDRQDVLVHAGVRFEAANGCSFHCRAGLLAYFTVAPETASPED